MVDEGYHACYLLILGGTDSAGYPSVVILLHVVIHFGIVHKIVFYAAVWHSGKFEGWFVCAWVHQL